jgi:hypothetical protein
MKLFSSEYGVARTIYTPIIKRASVDFAVSADWTPAAGDVRISKDGGASANVTNLPTSITMNNTAIWAFALTATEMEAAQVSVTVADSATKAVEDDAFVIETWRDGASSQMDLRKIADAFLKRDMSAVSGASSRSPLNALRVLRNRVNVAAGTMTVYLEDDTTSAWTASVTSDAGANPITGVDPA